MFFGVLQLTAFDLYFLFLRGYFELDLLLDLINKGEGYLIEYQLLRLLFSLKFDIFDGVGINNNIFIPHGSRYLLVLFRTSRPLLDDIFLAFEYRSKHNFPIFFLIKNQMLLLHLLSIKTTGPPLFDSFLYKFKILLSDSIDLEQYLIDCDIAGEILIQKLLEFFLRYFFIVSLFQKRRRYFDLPCPRLLPEKIESLFNQVLTNAQFFDIVAIENIFNYFIWKFTLCFL